MRFLVATDKYKGSFDAKTACNIIKKAIIDIDKNNQVKVLPLADGGEGTLEALCEFFNAEIFSYEVKDPLFRIIKSKIAFFEDKAIIEMSKCSGLLLLNQNERNPVKTTTYGVGELISYAIEKNVKEIIIGIGGSATNDAGIGMLSALGMRFLDEKNQELIPIGENLYKIKKIDDSNFNKRVLGIKFTVLCDVDNPLYGEKGAAYIFAPQKGANNEDISLLDKGLRNFAKVSECYLGKDYSQKNGAGAAGGLGFALLAFLNAQYISGIEYLLEASKADELVKWADYIITGEGRFDTQSLSGKSTIGLSKLAKKYNKPVIVLPGSIDCPFDLYSKNGVTSVFSIVDMASSLERCLVEAERLLYETTKSLVNLLVFIENKNK